MAMKEPSITEILDETGFSNQINSQLKTQTSKILGTMAIWHPGFVKVFCKVRIRGNLHQPAEGLEC